MRLVDSVSDSSEFNAVVVSRYARIARKENDDDATIGSDVGATGSELLSQEAAKAVAEELASGTILDETKVQVLYKILTIFMAEANNKEAGKKRAHQKKSYTLLVPIIDAGLESSSRLASTTEDSSWLDPLWEAIIGVLTHLLTPVRTASSGSYMARSASLLEILKPVVSYAPRSEQERICGILTSGVASSTDVAQGQADIAANECTPSDVRRKTKTRAEEALKVFEACFDGLCKLGPHSRTLHQLSRSILTDALPDEGRGDDGGMNAIIATIACRVISRNSAMERLAIEIFALLSRLISVEDEELRREAGNILSGVHVGEVLEEATRRCEAAEERAQEAEAHVHELMDEIEDLREENQSLHQQILVYSTSSALT